MSTVLTTAFNIFFVLMQIDPRQIVEESQRRTMTQSQRYEGSLRVIESKNRVTEKRWQYDRIGSHGSSKAVLRFTAPAEVKGVALLVLNHPDRSSDQWVWTAALNRDRRIALQDRSTRFFGTDFKLRRPRGARYKPVRFQASRRRAHRWRQLLESSVHAEADKGFAIYTFLPMDTRGQLRFRPD